MNETSKQYEKSVLRGVAIVAAVILVAYGATSSFVGLSFQPLDGDDPLAVLGRLALIALFVERGTEVLVELWRGARKNHKKHTIELIREQKRIAAGDVQKQNELQEQLNKLSEELHHWKATTTRIALWSGFLFGLLVSVAGVQTLQALFAFPKEGTQHVLLRGLDILLTASLISGGSEGIHKVANVYKTFMEESESKLKRQKQNADQAT